MTVSALSSPVSYSAVNANFDSLEADAAANMPRTTGSKPMVRRVDKNSVSSGSTEDSMSIEFVPDQDEVVEALCIEVWSPDATVRTLTLTIESMVLGGDGTTLSVDNYYLGGAAKTVSRAVSASGVGRTRSVLSTTDRFFLFKNVRYRMRLSSNNASAVNRVEGVICSRVYRQKS